MIGLSQPIIWESEIIESEVSVVTFTGTVKSGSIPIASKLVTVTVTKPDATKVSVTATTDALGAYSATYTANPGNYSAQASTLADALYSAGLSPSVSFTIGLDPVTITLSVN